MTKKSHKVAKVVRAKERYKPVVMAITGAKK
jgi:hypothetical protein